MGISNAYARMMKRLAPATRDRCAHAEIGRRCFWLLLFLAAALAVEGLAGCGGGGTNIMVGIIPSTAQMVDQGSSLTFQATTANDTSNNGAGAGVTWMVTGSGCAGTGCGTLSNVMTNSVKYTAPSGDTATLSVTLTATSITNTKATATVTISVELPPTFTAGQTLPGGTNGTPYSQQIEVTNGVAPLTFTLAPGNSLPAGLTLNSSGLISGRPTGPAPPPAPNPTLFNVVVTDSANPPTAVVSPQFSIAINPAPKLLLTQTSPLPPATLNVPYGITLATSGGVRPFTWSILSGCLPTGLQLGPVSGQLTGAALNVPNPACSFTPQVVDSSIPPQQVSAPAALTIPVQTAPALSVTGGVLPQGSVASPYSASIGITGGVPPYQNIVVTNGQLPSGLSLNPTTGVITGNPMLVGTSTFSVQVEDSATPPNVATSPVGTPLSIAIIQGTTDPNTLLSGSYAFQFNGYNSQGTVQIAGVFTANGDGKITGGTEDVNQVSAVPITLAATFTGTYSITPDGRGTMQINALNSVGQQFNSGYRFVLDSSGNGRFFEDNSVLTVQPPLATHGVGQFKLQQLGSFSASNLGGNYAFAFSGLDFNNKPAALVGTIHADQSSTLGPGVADFNDAGAYSPAMPLSGNFSVSSSNGRGESSLLFQPTKQPQTTLNFSFYFVSPTDLFFVETDAPTNTAPQPPRLSGEMVLQQPAVKFDATALATPAVATGTGLGTNASVFVGLLSPCAGGVCITYSENNGGTVTNPVVFNNGTFSVADTGRVDFTNGNGEFTLGPRVAAAYLTGVSTGFLIGSDPAVTVGLLEQQTGGVPNFNASSVFDGYTLSDPVTAENMVKDLVGQTVADGSATISGTLDELDPNGTLNVGSGVAAGFFIANPLTGQGSLTVGSPPPGLDTNYVFYIVSPSSFRAVSIDSTDSHPAVLFFDH